MQLSGYRRVLIVALCWSLGWMFALPERVRSEWYVGAYGGVSLDGRILNPSLPTYGQNMATQYLYPNTSPTKGDYTTSNFSLTEALKLKNSPMFGVRAGYYFNNFGFPWAGLEVEAFTTQPDIKQQTVPYTNTVTSVRQTLPPNPPPPQQPETRTCPGPTPPNRPVCPPAPTIGESDLRVSTVALNAVVRYPGKIFQPYAGVGLGLFYFQGSSNYQGPLPAFKAGDPPLKFNGSQWQPGLNTFAGMKFFFTEKIALFGEYKYNRATINNLDDMFGLKGDYSIMHLLGGVAYHF